MEKEMNREALQNLSHTHTQTQSVNKATVNYNGLAQKPYPMVQFNREKYIPPSLNNFTPQCIRDTEKKGGVMERMRVTWDRRQEERRGTEGKHMTPVSSEAGTGTKTLRLWIWLHHNRSFELTVRDRLIKKEGQDLIWSIWGLIRL